MVNKQNKERGFLPLLIFLQAYIIYVNTNYRNYFQMNTQYQFHKKKLTGELLIALRSVPQFNSDDNSVLAWYIDQQVTLTEMQLVSQFEFVEAATPFALQFAVSFPASPPDGSSQEEYEETLAHTYAELGKTIMHINETGCMPFEIDITAVNNKLAPTVTTSPRFAGFWTAGRYSDITHSKTSAYVNVELAGFILESAFREIQNVPTTVSTDDIHTFIQSPIVRIMVPNANHEFVDYSLSINFDLPQYIEPLRSNDADVQANIESIRNTPLSELMANTEGFGEEAEYYLGYMVPGEDERTALDVTTLAVQEPGSTYVASNDGFVVSPGGEPMFVDEGQRITLTECGFDVHLDTDDDDEREAELDLN
jgi:hypothetical protein